MNGTLKRYLLASMIGLLDLMTLAQGVHPQIESKLAIKLSVANYAQVPEQILQEAGQQVRQIFDDVGIETRWVLLTAGQQQTESLPSIFQDSSTLELRIVISSLWTLKTVEKYLGKQDAIFGMVTRSENKPSSIAYILYQRIQKFVQLRGLFS